MADDSDESVAYLRGIFALCAIDGHVEQGDPQERSALYLNVGIQLPSEKPEGSWIPREFFFLPLLIYA